MLHPYPNDPGVALHDRSITPLHPTPEQQPTQPHHRYIMASEFNPEQSDLVVFGGNADPFGGQYRDAWRYDFGAWEPLPSLPADAPCTRPTIASAVWAKHPVDALGDRNDNATECQTNEPGAGQKPTDQTWTLNLNRNSARYGQWSRLMPPTPPTPLKRVAWTRVGSQLFVWGGFNYLCLTEQLSGHAEWNQELWVLNMAGLD